MLARFGGVEAAEGCDDHRIADGKVARGGLRWSDRREDFRTEILGLMKAQTVKNPVIVTRFISKNTIEERIDRVLREKRELFEAILGDGDNNNVSLGLNATEIFGLFDLKARHKDGSKSIGPKPAQPESDAA